MENQETPKINITPKPEKIFREKTDKTLDKSVFSYSDEQENIEWPYGEKQLLILDENKNRIGQIQFNYPETDAEQKLFKTRIVIINDEYKNKDLGITLYKKLIDLAKEKGFDGIKSDNSVVGGAIATWKKLADEGYQIKVNLKVKEKYEEFVKVYDEGKFFKEGLEVPKEESVFELLLNNKDLKNKYSQEIIDYVWKRLASEGITNADSIIGTRESIKNEDFEKFWNSVKEEDIKNLITAYEDNKARQLKNFETYKNKYQEGDFVPELGEMLSQDTSWWDSKISDLNSLLK